MPKVHRRGVAVGTKKANKRHKRGCRSAPALPSTFTATYIRRDVHHNEEWKARIKWSPVTSDVAGRPLSVEEYEVQLRATNASGVPLETDGADNDFWSHTEKAHGPTANERCIFFPLPHPKTWYFQARIRVLNRVHGTKCWSGWSGWTTPTQPATGAIAGPPAPTGVTITLDKVEGTKKHPWRARSKWNTSPDYTPTGGDLTGISQYGVKLEVSHNGGSTVANIRREQVDHDASLTTHHKNWFNIKRKRSYRTSVRAQDQYGNWGAYSTATSWTSIGGDPDDVSNVVSTNPTVGTLKTTWDLPTDLSDVDGIKVEIKRKDGGGGTIVETDYLGSHRTQYTYDIPFADRTYNHTALVHTFEDEINLDLDTGSVGWDVATVSPGVESSEIAVDRELEINELDITIETHRLMRADGVPRVRMRRASAQSIPDGAGTHIVNWDTEEVDTDAFGDPSSDEFTMPWDGSYRVTAVARFADNNTGRRTCFVQLQALGAGGWSDLPTLYSSISSVNGDVSVPLCCNTIQVNATDKLRVHVFQNSGGDLDMTDASFAAEFLGPA